MNAVPPSPEIDAIRDASRRLVRALGFLRPGLAGTELSPSSVHALLEIGAGVQGATQLAERLLLDKSSVSRLLRRLLAAGLLQEAPDGRDGRAKRLSLTPAGAARLAAIHRHAGAQVAEALGRLTPAQQRTVAEGLALYAGALAGRAPASTPAVTIEAGWQPGVLGRCAELHARYYARQAGFGAGFEAIVAAGLAEFSARLDRPGNGLWLARCDGAVVGTVAIDGEDLGPGVAHLRWFIVEDGRRGLGLGRRLLGAALGFCDARAVPEVQLWTFRGLDAARHLYETHGFALAEERAGRQWATEVMEQRFVRRRPGGQSCSGMP